MPGAISKQPYQLNIDPKVPLIAVCLVGLIMAYLLGQIKQDSTKVLEMPADESIFIAPYDDYVITQGLHGFTYGHMAVDLAAGKGSLIKSPINGKVAANYMDYLGNTTLVIENAKFEVTLLHGKYDVKVGDLLTAGQVVGTESNLGNTTDMFGTSCRGRECGFHTHLNVYQKVKKKNINPLNLIAR